MESEHKIGREISVWCPEEQMYGAILVHEHGCPGCISETSGDLVPAGLVLFESVDQAVSAIAHAFRSGKQEDLC